MTRFLILIAVVLSVPAFSQKKPSVLEGVKFQTETLVTEKGEEFTAFLVEEDFKKLFSMIKRLKVTDRFKSGNIKYSTRETEGFEFLITRGFGTKSITIYEL
jgi:hypothetical protein